MPIGVMGGGGAATYRCQWLTRYAACCGALRRASSSSSTAPSTPTRRSPPSCAALPSRATSCAWPAAAAAAAAVTSLLPPTRSLKERAEITLVESIMIGARAGGGAAAAAAKGAAAVAAVPSESDRERRRREREERELAEYLEKVQGPRWAAAAEVEAASARARQPLSAEAARALADVASHGGSTSGGGRGNPYTAALYVKLCERYDSLSVAPETLIKVRLGGVGGCVEALCVPAVISSPSTLPQQGDATIAPLYDSLKEQARAVAEAAHFEPEGTVDDAAEHEMKLRDLRRRSGFCRGGGSPNVVSKAQARGVEGVVNGGEGGRSSPQPRRLPPVPSRLSPCSAERHRHAERPRLAARAAARLDAARLPHGALGLQRVVPAHVPVHLHQVSAARLFT